MEYNHTIVDDLWSVLNSENLVMNQEPSMVIDTFTKSNNKLEMSPALSPAATVPPSPAFSNTSEYSTRDYPSPVQNSQPAVDELNWISQCIMDNPEFAVAALESDIANVTSQSVSPVNNVAPMNSYMTPLTVPQTAYQPPVPQPPQIPTPQSVMVKQEPMSPKPVTQSTGGRPRQKGISRIVTGNNTELDEVDLTSLPVRELNKRLQGCGRDEILKIKQKRRTLKNRGYAQNCRTKRMMQRSELEEENHILSCDLSKLQNEMHKMQLELHKVTAQRDMYRNQCDSLRQRNGSESTLPSSPDSITFT